jgi:hypothetical protein
MSRPSLTFHSLPSFSHHQGQCGVVNRAHQKTPHKVTKLQSRKDKISAIACGQHTSAAIEEGGAQKYEI